jgi:hypothetical protein
MAARRLLRGVGSAGALRWAGLVALALCCVGPLWLERHPGRFVRPQEAVPGGKFLVVGLMGLAVAIRGWADRPVDRRAAGTTAGLFLTACLLTCWHWYAVDSGWFEIQEGGARQRYYNSNWQKALYQAVLSHFPTSYGEVWVPHIYRPLPYGFTRLLERLTGDWLFACLAYRCFFTFWFLWAYYRFVRLFLPLGRGLTAVAVYLALFPLSVQYYMGQLTDPMSHALFALGLIYIVENNGPALLAALALGVGAKETAVVLVPAYAACGWRRGRPALAWTAVLTAASVAAFLAFRAPYGWSLRYESIHGSEGLMILDNLGLGGNTAGAAPLYENYVQPLVFVGLFLPLVARNWRRADARLRALFLTLTPAILGTSLCFSWLHESRNYVPLLPVLTSLALWPPQGQKTTG